MTPAKTAKSLRKILSTHGPKIGALMAEVESCLRYAKEDPKIHKEALKMLRQYQRIQRMEARVTYQEVHQLLRCLDNGSPDVVY